MQALQSGARNRALTICHFPAPNAPARAGAFLVGARCAHSLLQSRAPLIRPVATRRAGRVRCHGRLSPSPFAQASAARSRRWRPIRNALSRIGIRRCETLEPFGAAAGFDAMTQGSSFAARCTSWPRPDPRRDSPRALRRGWVHLRRNLGFAGTFDHPAPHRPSRPHRLTAGIPAGPAL